MCSFKVVELEFGFEVNAELLKGSGDAAVGTQQQQQEEKADPIRSIDAMDAAILSFGPSGPAQPAMGMMPVMIPVEVPFGMFPATGLPAFLPFPLMHQVFFFY
jgi:hypothetical protein